MKLFIYKDRDLVIACYAFNRGHAAKQIAKHVEAKGQEFLKTCPLEELPEPDEKGALHVLRDYDFT